MNDMKKCPRCGLRTMKNMRMCGRCELNYDKLAKATNAEAHIAVRCGEPDRILMANELPRDINKKSLILLSLFLGWLGIHRLRVARRISGVVMMTLSVLSLSVMTVCLLYKAASTSALLQICGATFGIILIVAVVDFFNIILGKFKVPRALPYEVK